MLSLTNIFVPSRKLNKAQSRSLICFFALNIWKQSFLLLNFTIVRLFFTLWQTWMLCWPISTPTFRNTLSTLSSSASSFTEVGIPSTSRYSCREHWAFAQHCLSVSTNWSTNRELTFSVTATSAPSLFRWLLISLISAFNVAIWAPMFASVFSSSWSSGLLSLFNIASVWVPAIIIGVRHNKTETLLVTRQFD